ncbi:MAG: hypothetical protein ACXWN4_00315 [Candidatus Limnocylindrales bacterium]
MGTLERTETLAHRLGTNGRISIKTIGGLLRVRGIDGEEARMTIAYRIRATDHAAAERALETGRILVDRGPGSLEVETPERRLSSGLAWLFGGARVSADIAIDVPWGTQVRLETMSGSIEAISLIGDQKYRTVAGDIRLWGLGGLVEAGTISGSISLDSGGDLRLRCNTISGGIRARANCFHGMILSSTSGSIAVVGALDPAGDHRAESISGTVSLTPLTGVTAELRTVSGSITSEIEHRVEGGRGFWRSIVGDGSSAFRVNSTSGGLKLLAARPEDRPAAAPGPSATAAASSATGTPAGREEAESSESWDPDETADANGGPAQEEELAVLQALERGDIGVDEAAERLDRARR